MNLQRILALAVLLGVLMPIGTILADDISNNLDITVDSSAENLPLVIGNPDGSVTLRIIGVSGDGDNGCNFEGNESATFNVLNSDATKATVSPSSITFTALNPGCSADKVLTIHALTPGVTTISLSAPTFNNTNGTFNTAPATFTVTVTAPADTTKPVITANVFPLANGNGWNNTDVAVNFACTDEIGGSGIATNTVAGQTLTTEGENQSVTNTGTCIDAAGNIADPVAVTGINIDKTAPIITLTTPAQNDQFLQFSSINANWSVDAGISGLDSTTGTVANGSPIDTSTVGAYEFEVSATDMAGNTASVNHEYTVFTYLFSGPSSPVSISSKEFKKTSTIPVKFQVLNSVTGLPLQGPTAQLWVNSVAAKASGSSNTGNWFRYDPVAQQYIYNLSTKSLVLGSNNLQITFTSAPPTNPSVITIVIR